MSVPSIMTYKDLCITAVSPSMLKGMTRHGGTHWVPKRRSTLRIQLLHLSCCASVEGSHAKVIWVQTESKVSKPTLHMTSPDIASHPLSVRREALHDF